MNISIEVDSKQLTAALARSPRIVKGHLNGWIARTAARTEREAKKRVPVDTGRLQSSIQTRFGSLQATVKPEAKYAIYVHEGTGIYARNGRGRKTPWFAPLGDLGGGATFGFWTKGQKPKPFMEDARRVVKPLADIDAKDTLSKIVSDI